MKEKINSIDMNGKIDHEEIYNLFKTHSSKINKEISEKINIFSQNKDFFKYYSNKDIDDLFNIFELELSENPDEPLSSFKSDIDKYISCISQIILLIKLSLKTQEILKKLVINSKDNLSKLKIENKLENYNQEYLFLFIESFIKDSEKNPKTHESSILSSNNSSFEIIPKDSQPQKFFSDHYDFPDDEIESFINDIPGTPRFQSDEKLENQKRKISDLEKSVENSTEIKNNSIFTLSEYIFNDEPSTPNNIQSNLIDPPIIKPKVKNTYPKVSISETEEINKVKNKRHLFSSSDLIIKNKKKIHCLNLLEMIKKMYKKGIINSEEKVKLKQLVIEKSKKIEHLYYKIYKNLKNDKNTLVDEVKKIVN